MPKIFSEEERLQVRIGMFESGFGLLKKEGMIHMSVEKITSAAGIGKSTFYNFFRSKEDFVLQMIEYKRQNALKEIQNRLNGREKMTVEEGKDIFRSILFSSNSIYQYLKLEDLAHLQKEPSYLNHPDMEEEKDLLCSLLRYIQGVKKNPDYLLIANLIKIMTLAVEDRSLLHEGAYAKTMDMLLETLYACIFDEEE